MGILLETYSTYNPVVFKASIEPPSVPKDGHYDFAEQVFIAPNGWSENIPPEGENLWVSRGCFKIYGDAATDYSAEWSEPVDLASCAVSHR